MAMLACQHLPAVGPTKDMMHPKLLFIQYIMYLYLNLLPAGVPGSREQEKPSIGCQKRTRQMLLRVLHLQVSTVDTTSVYSKMIQEFY